MRIYGYRTSKTVNGTTTDYTLEGSKVLIEKTGSDYVWYYYDAAGAPVAMATGSGPSLYIYRKNLQGDVTCIYSGSTGTLLVSYVYDAWGKVTATNVANTTESSMVLARNPYLYRGYRYDLETGLYYLNSRYYDPETGRFINADGFVSTGQGILASNMFAYCENNPVVRVDSEGDFWEAFLIGFAVGLIGQYVSDVIENIESGKTGVDIFTPTSSTIDYIASGVGTLIAAYPGLDLLGTMAVGAAGNFATDAIKGNIKTVEDAGRSMAEGAIANGLGYLATKAVAAVKVSSMKGMSRTENKVFLRDKVFHSSQAQVNQNLREFANYTFGQKVTKIANGLRVLRSGIFSTVTSTMALLLK